MSKLNNAVQPSNVHALGRRDTLPVEIPARTRTIVFPWSFMRSKMFIGVVLTPNILSVLYWGLLAAPLYQSEAIVMVSTPEKSPDSMLSALAGGSGASTSGAWILKNRLLSWDEFRSIDQRFHLARLYGSGDFWARAGGAGSLWKTDDISLWRYYQSQISVSIDEQTGITKIVVNGWNPVDALTLSKALMADGMKSINTLNERSSKDYVRAAEDETHRLEAALASDEREIAQWRSTIGYLSPGLDYSALTEQAARYKSKLLDLDSQYQVLMKSAPLNPSIANLKVAMSVVSAAHQQAQSASQKIFPSAVEYETLDLRRKADNDLLVTAKTALQQARIKAAQHQYYLDTISPPSEPRAPSGPRRLMWILGTLLLTLFIRMVLS